jgi:hypothetical protein
VQSLSAALAPSSSDVAGSRSAALGIAVTPRTPSVRVVVGEGRHPVARAARVLLTATASVTGTVTFSAGGADVVGCVGVRVEGATARCWWTPRVDGVTSVSARLAPASPDYATVSSSVRAVVDPPQSTRVVGPFVGDSAALSHRGALSVESLASLVSLDGYRVVTVVGLGGPSAGVVVARERADAVAALLARDLTARGVDGVRFVVAVRDAAASGVVVVVDY